MFYYNKYNANNIYILLQDYFTFKQNKMGEETTKIPQAIFQVSHPINHPSHHLESLFHHLLLLKSHRQTESQKICLLSLNLYLKLNQKEYCANFYQAYDVTRTFAIG